MAFNWPWRRGGAVARVEQKAVPPGGHGGLVALHGQGEPRWTRRDYAALAREGYMRNPVVHRAVRMVAEAAACVPCWPMTGRTSWKRTRCWTSWNGQISGRRVRCFWKRSMARCFWQATPMSN